MIKHYCWLLVLFVCCLFTSNVIGQTNRKPLTVISADSGVVITIDEPAIIYRERSTDIIIFALPNRNTTAQTFGKVMLPGDDWHFDIQHIGAQTSFVRNTDQSKNYIVVYVENNLKSWPAWRKKVAGSGNVILNIVESIRLKYSKLNYSIVLSSHSGGGSFIFGYLNAVASVPPFVSKINFMDATYGYETELHKEKLNNWLKDKQHSLQIIAYNDSVVVYNGKPLVSPTGGTWYRSNLMARDLGLKPMELSDRIIFQKKNMEIILIRNPEAKIFHTVLVEKNGFIHALLGNTRFREKNYTFWGNRAYSAFIAQ